MKILFYLQPIVEGGHPRGREHHLWAFYEPMAKALEDYRGKGGFDYRVVVGEAFAGEGDWPQTTKKVVMSDNELLKPFPSGRYGEASHSCYFGSNTAAHNHYIRCIRKKLVDFVPDVIFSTTRIPFLTQTFSSSLPVFIEYGIFSRYPYPATMYLDPCGMMLWWPNYLFDHWSWIRSEGLTEVQEERLGRFKKKCRNAILGASPFRQRFEQLSSRFDHILLVPLSGESYAEQFDYLAALLSKVSSRTGVIVTTHADHTLDAYSGMNYLSSRFPNLIWSEDFDHYYSQSQFLVAHADTIVARSPSSVTYQALLWDTKLLVHGASQQFFADETRFDHLQALLERDLPPHRQKWKNQFLYWLLTRYCPEMKYVLDGKWLSRFLEQSLERFRSEGVTHRFYDLIDDEDAIFASLEKGLEDAKAEPVPWTGYSYDRLRTHCSAQQEKLAQMSALLQKLTGGVRGFQNLMGEFERTEQPPSVLLKAAEACIEFGISGVARSFLSRVIESDPHNLVAHQMLAKLG